MIAIIARLCRQIESDGETGLTLGEVLAIKRIRLLRRRMSRIGPKDPRLVAHAAPISSALRRSSSDQPEDEQQDHRADKGADDLTNKSGPDVDAESRQQPTRNESADYSDDDVADQTE